MNPRRDHQRYWALLAGQAVGSQLLLWGGLPIYKEMHRGTMQAPPTAQFAAALAVAAFMLACHWPALTLRRRLQFRRSVLLGHVLIWIGELSLFFSATLTAFIVFDRFHENEVEAFRAVVLAVVLFAVTSYKYQIMSLGEALIQGEPEPDHPAVQAEPATGDR